MTAEVAILNREAVALAADSAVTLTGPKGRKIYNTANKLFALSTDEPVAVMVYGNVSFGTIPWTTIIKEYHRKLGSSTSPTIDQYASDFFEYILSTTKHLSDQALQQQVESKELEHPIESSVNKFVKEHTNQIESIVQWLPQEELTEMAETLVNLTSFKRRVTPEDDTVGGPVDVAVVTKGDGFVWIKRKNFYERG